MAKQDNGELPSTKNMLKPVREKAADIKQALEEEKNMEEGRAASIATAKAQEWAENNDQRVWQKGKKPKSKK